MEKEFEKFLESAWELEVCLPAGRQGMKIIFRSKKSGVRGLLDFINKRGRRHRNLVIFDKIVGRGAALLAVYLRAKEVYGSLGSESAAETLRKYKIKFYFQKIIPSILDKNQTDICPIEKLSFNKTPKELYHYLRGRLQIKN